MYYCAMNFYLLKMLISLLAVWLFLLHILNAWQPQKISNALEVYTSYSCKAYLLDCSAYHKNIDCKANSYAYIIV